MTRPETCGAAGGAISLWLKLFDTSSPGGLISSWASESSGSTGSMMNLLSDNLQYYFLLSDSI